MTNREREILEIIKKQPDIEQSEIASRSISPVRPLRCIYPTFRKRGISAGGYTS